MHTPPSTTNLLGALACALALSACGDDGMGATIATDTTGTGATGTTAASSTPTTTTTPTTTMATQATGTDSGSVSMTGMESGSSAGPTTDMTGSTAAITTQTTTSNTDGTTTISSSTSTTGNSSSSGGGDCADGTIVCDANTAKTCDGMGGFKDEMVCPGVCVDGVGCVDCLEGDTQCVGNVSQLCNNQNKWVDDESCDILQGLMCDANEGTCAGTCTKQKLGTSYIGCDYFPATLANLHETQPWVFFYAVVVANTTAQEATVTVTKGINVVAQVKVAPNNAKVVQLPYVDALVTPTINEAGPSRVVVDGSYRLRSNQPVTVYQYEPYDYTAQNLFSFTNDASLLLPVNTWTGNYIVASRNHWPVQGLNLPGWYAVIAREDNTKVTLVPSATGKLVSAGGGVAGNGSGEIILNESDVLEVFTVSGGGVPDASDLTGTIINADKPVQVFAGHKCTQIPVGQQACDRLEEAMLPIETLSKKYIVGPPLIPNMQVKAQMVRVIATEDATALTYDPPQGGAPAMLAKAGDYAEIAATNKDFQIVSDKKILVSQYMQSQSAGGNIGDPAMALAVATEQYRSKYLIHAPLSYDTNFANVTAPMDAKVTMDGAPIPALTAIGGTGFGVARLAVPDNADGNHDFVGDKPFGVTIYGYGQYTSYWYPGGLDLEALPQ